MSRPLWSFLAAALVVVAAPPGPAVGHEHSTGYAYGYNHGDNHDDDFGWTIVEGGDTSMSDMNDMQSLEDLKDTFGDHFLYIRDGDDRYVITDEDLVARGRRASLSMKYYGKQLGQLGRERSHSALKSRKYAQKMAAIGRLQGELGRELARRSVNGESTEKLRREMKELSEQMDELRADLQTSQNTDSDSRDLERRTQDLSKRMQKAVREAEKEMHDILHDAKAQHLAKRVN